MLGPSVPESSKQMLRDRKSRDNPIRSPDASRLAGRASSEKVFSPFSLRLRNGLKTPEATTIWKLSRSEPGQLRAWETLWESRHMGPLRFRIEHRQATAAIMCIREKVSLSLAYFTGSFKGRDLLSNERHA